MSSSRPSHGVGDYWKNLVRDPDTRHAIFLTLIVAPLAVAGKRRVRRGGGLGHRPLQFPGRTLLTTLIDLPFSVSPVVVGLDV